MNWENFLTCLYFWVLEALMLIFIKHGGIHQLSKPVVFFVETLLIASWMYLLVENLIKFVLILE